MDLQQLIEQITPDIYRRLKTAVEIGRWPDGRSLTAQQRELCLQAIISYDQRLPEEERVGYVPRKNTASADDDQTTEKPVKWRN